MTVKSIDLNNFTLEDFWGQVIQFKNQKYPDPTWITLYQARKELGFTDRVIKRLHSEGFIRSNNETPPMYAKEDILEMGKIRSILAEFEKNEIVKNQVVKNQVVMGKKKYLVIDNYDHKNSAEKYKAGLVLDIFKSYFGDQYDLVPKTKIDEK